MVLASSPTEPRATWYHRQQPIEQSEKYKMSIFLATDDTDADIAQGFYTFAVRIDVTPAEVGDEGEWKCEVSNEGGKIESTCNVRLAGNS